jgi:hypothetical protein
MKEKCKRYMTEARLEKNRKRRAAALVVRKLKLERHRTARAKKYIPQLEAHERDKVPSDVWRAVYPPVERHGDRCGARRCKAIKPCGNH